MRVWEGFLALAFAIGLCGQTAADPEIARAKANIERLRFLVDAGAVPRMELQKAEDALADAEDHSFLLKTLYGQDLTIEQSDEMVQAANRRLERRKKAYAEAKRLVDAGAAGQLSLGAYLQDLDFARKECDLAESRARLTREIAESVRAEQELEAKLAEERSEAPADRFEGDGIFTPSIFAQVETAFEEHFGKPLPVSAMGETEVHRALGFDHRGRVDVAIHPDTPEGIWLRQYLTGNRIPYIAFRQAEPGKATGAHIHLGPMSTRLKLGG
jgi:hypothetical protein